MSLFLDINYRRGPKVVCDAGADAANIGAAVPSAGRLELELDVSAAADESLGSPKRSAAASDIIHGVVGIMRPRRQHASLGGGVHAR